MSKLWISILNAFKSTFTLNEEKASNLLKQKEFKRIDNELLRQFVFELNIDILVVYDINNKIVYNTDIATGTNIITEEKISQIQFKGPGILMIDKHNKNIIDKQIFMAKLNIDETSSCTSLFDKDPLVACLLNYTQFFDIGALYKNKKNQ